MSNSSVERKRDHRREIISLLQIFGDSHLQKKAPFDLPEEEVRRRLRNRREQENRADDSEETQSKRIQVYEEQTRPLVAYYRNLGLLKSLDASGSVDEVHTALMETLAG